jgi:basic membrane lipoprotein Med (substrate-binding protein (PBP1-ABC) superfamily)
MKPSQFFSRRQALVTMGAAGASLLAPSLVRPALATGALATPLDPKDLVIAFGHVGPTTDEGWTWSHHVGRKAIEKEWPEVRFIEVESVPFSAQGTRIVRQFVGQGAKMVFLTTDYADLSASVIKASPDVAFLECNSFTTEDNKSAYYIKHWDPTYVIGVAAAMLTKSKKLGYVASYPTPSVNMSINAFHLGARSVDPTIETQAIYINSWFDPQAARQAGTALIQNGCDFLMGIMDEAAYLQVAEEKGIWAAMWNTDLRRYGPNAYVSSMMLDWNAYYVEEVRARLEGKWTGGRTVLLPMGNGTDRDVWGGEVPADVAARADEVRTKMMGGHNPFTGEIKDVNGAVKLAVGQAMTDDEKYTCDWIAEGVTARS